MLLAVYEAWHLVHDSSESDPIHYLKDASHIFAVAAIGITGGLAYFFLENLSHGTKRLLKISFFATAAVCGAIAIGSSIYIFEKDSASLALLDKWDFAQGLCFWAYLSIISGAFGLKFLHEFRTLTI